MSDTQTIQDTTQTNVVEVLALFKLGRINREDIGPENQTVLSYYLGLMAENESFSAKVHSRMEQLRGNGRKVPLFPPEVIKNLKKKKRRIKKRVFAFQLNFFPAKLSQDDGSIGQENIRDSDSTIFKVGRQLDNPYINKRRTVLAEDVRRRRLELRELIGLPIARGKSRHVNDPNYKFLVKRICTFDQFGIFEQYDRVYADIPEDLNLKIQQIMQLIDELLNNNLTRRQFFRRFDEFVENYQSYWNNPM